MAGSAHTWADGDAPNTTWLNAIPYGVMAYVQGSTSNQTGISAQADITSLSVTFTAISTRLYVVVLMCNVQQVTSGGNATVSITDGANTTKQNAVMTLSTSAFAPMMCFEQVTGLSGSTTRKGRAETTAGTLTIAAYASTFARLIVLDVGPA